MKNLKKLIKVLCMAVLLISVSFELIYASNQWEVEKLADVADDYQEIKNLETMIQSSLKDFYHHVKGVCLPENFELNIGQARKVYVDAPVFSLKNSDADLFLQELKNSDYMWLLPVQVGDDVFQIHIARGLPVREAIRNELSEDEIRRIEEKEGKWNLSGIELLKDNRVDFELQISEALEQLSYDQKDMQVVLCGGLNHIDNPAAIVLSNQKAELLIPLYDLQIVGTPQQIDDLKPQSARTDTHVYLYDKIKEAANSMPSMAEYSGGGAYLELQEQDTLNVSWYLPAGCIAVIMLLAIRHLYQRNCIKH